MGKFVRGEYLNEKLKAENARLRAENASLRASLASARKEQERVRCVAMVAAIDNMADAEDSRYQRSRADRYLAAMTALVETDGTDAEWLAPLAAIRAIVEEARRG